MTLARALAAVWFAMSTDSASTLQKAEALMQSRDYDGAISVLAPLVRDEPANARAWLAYGAALHGKGELDRALEAHEKEASFEATRLQAMYNFIIESDEDDSALGAMFVSVVGDVDADGVPDVYASDWSSNANGAGSGRIYVHSGATGERLLALAGEAPGDGFGIGPADAGDVDGDGHDDLVVGAWQHGGRAPWGGKVYLFSGKDGALLRAWTAKIPGETFGFDATGMGDVDGDGGIDLLLTSAWSPARGSRTGRMFILSAKP